MKRILSLMLAAAVLILCLAACGNETAETQPATAPAATVPAAEAAPASTEETITGKITIWVWTTQAPYIEAYEAAHPGTEIEEVVVDSGSYLTKVQTTLASGGDLPDLLFGEILSRGQLFGMDILEDLSADPYNYDISKVDPSVHKTMYGENGELLGVELAVNPAGLAYDRSLA